MAGEKRHDGTADLALVCAVLANEESAIIEFADRLKCVPRILTAQNVRLGRPLDEHDLADLSQDIVVVILQKLHRFAGRAPVEGWIYKVCRLEFMNGVRRKRRVPRPVHDVEVAMQNDPGRTSALAERESIAVALARVGGVEAEAVTMKHFEGLTFEEMCTRLDLPSSTVKTRYYKGLARLEELLEGEQP